MKVERIGRTFAAEISNIDIDENTVRTHRHHLHQAYLEHKVIVIRGQKISPEIFSAFGRIFGEAEIHHVRAMRHPTIPALTLLSNQAEPGRNDVMKHFGDGWHADSSYKPVTAAATMLWGMEIPDEGGDTLFADAEAAFGDLPDIEKEALRKLRLRQQYRWSSDRSDPWARWKFVGEDERRDTPEVVHPLVKRHPETGKESLHIVVWDIRSLLHSATTRHLSDNKVRRLLRITTTGQSLVGMTPEAGATEIVPGTEFA